MPVCDQLTIGIDVGTSSCKSTVVAASGRVVAEAGAGYSTRRLAGGEVSQDPADWLRAVRDTLKRACGEIDPGAVAAIGITAPAHYAVLLDRERRPLGRVLLSSDARPAATATRMRAAMGERFFETTGVALTAGWTLPQLRWLLDEEPSMRQRLATVLVAKDWIRAELTGESATDPSDAQGTGLFDLGRGAWSPELLDAAGIDVKQVPPIRPAVSVGGVLSSTWARRVGLRAGIPVAVGATDTAAELVSLAAVEPGNSIVKVASTGTVVVVTDAPRPDARLLTYPHAMRDRWYGVAATSTAATSDTWWRGVLVGSDADGGSPRDEARRLARRVAPGSEGLLFLPYLEGERSPRWDAGLRGAFLGLSSAHGQAHLNRAVLEGVAMSLRDCRDAMADAGLRLADPVLAGGGMRDPLWRRIVVDVLNTDARYVARQGPSIGAAMIAGKAIGIDVGGRRSGSSASGRRVRPDPAAALTYDRLYDLYREAADALTDVSHDLARGFATK